VVSQSQGLATAVSFERERRLAFNDASRFESDALDVAADSRWFKTGLLKLRCDIIGSALVAGAACIPAFHAVVSQSFNVRPPRRMGGLQLLSLCRQYCENCQDDWTKAAHEARIQRFVHAGRGFMQFLIGAVARS